ncbi:hypothetical protein NUW58_g9206 [Xylaria curta]|uniref:Uncharacterized protein n=1 Tax=Xylaria curta TaxID=42375 RepID=A0ACC1N1L0_9PEZI|nr:hypothetical protein NUW58_g9206 [Xylaria curta]
MADLQKSTPAKRALPFKRTARQKPSNDASSPVDDDGLSLFSQSKNYFPTVVEDQQRRAREKAEKAEKAEQERREKLAREKRKKEEEEEEEQEKERSSARKRRHLSLSGDEMPKYNDGDSDAN